MGKDELQKKIIDSRSITVNNRLTILVEQSANKKWYGFIKDDRTENHESVGPKDSFGEIMFELTMLGYKLYPKIQEEKC